MKIWRFSIVLAQIVKPRHSSNVVIELYTLRVRMFADLAHNKLEEFRREIIALTVHGLTELFTADVTTAILVHYKKILVFFIHVTEKVKKLFETDFHISVLVIA